MKQEGFEHKTIITPSRSYFFNFRELIRYKGLIFIFIKRDFTYLYKQTVLGPLWFFIQPLLTALLFVFVFNRVVKVPTGGIPPILFYLAGITLWNYFSDCFNKVSEAFIANKTIFEKVYFPRVIIPLSIVVSSLLKFFVQLFLFLLVYLFFIIFLNLDFKLTSALFLLPILIIIMATIGLGLGLLISSITIKYRDLRFVIQFGVQLFFFLTPVIYPLSSLSIKKQQLLLFNPFSSVIEAFKYAFLGEGVLSYTFLLYAGIFGLVSLALGGLFFSRIESRFVDLA